MRRKRKARRVLDTPAGEDARSPWVTAGGVFLFALALRLFYLWEIHDTPFFALILGDGAQYDAWASRLASGEWIWTEVFYQSPFYPYVLGAVYAVFGRDLTLVRVFQAVGGAASAAFLTVAAWRFFGARAGALSGLLLAAYGPALFYGGLIEKAGLDLLLVCWLLLLISVAAGAMTPARSFWTGVAMGCLGLSRENALALLPLVLAWTWQRGRSTIAPVLTLLLGAGVVLAPVAIRNIAVSGEFHLTTSQMGPNFYIGNSEHATGTYVALRSGHGSAQFEQRDAQELAEQALGRRLSAGEVSRFWRQRAMAWIAAHPADWVHLMGKKLLLVWNTAETSDSEDIHSYADVSVLLRVARTALHFGTLAPLGLLGMWLTRVRWRELWILPAMVTVYALTVASFFVFGRYRYPLVPLLIMFGGAALALGPSWLRHSRPGEKAVAALLFATALVMCNWPLVPERAMRAATRYNLGAVLQAQGRTEQAAAEYRSALELVPDLAAAHSNLAVILLGNGDLEGARRHADEAVRLDASVGEAHNNLAMVLAAQQRQADAIEEFRAAVERDPRNGAFHANLGTALAVAGQPQKAIPHLQEAVRLNPADATAHNNLGILLASSGRLGEAIEHFKTALELRPDFAEAQANLARALASTPEGR